MIWWALLSQDCPAFLANGLTFTGEVKLLFFLALVFGRGGIIGDGGVGSKRSPFGTLNLTSLLATVYLIPFSERSTPKFQALAWSPIGPDHQTSQPADYSVISIPSTTKYLWPALKFQDFRRLPQVTRCCLTTPSLGKHEKPSTFSRADRALSTTNSTGWCPVQMDD